MQNSNGNSASCTMNVIIIEGPIKLLLSIPTFLNYSILPQQKNKKGNKGQKSGKRKAKREILIQKQGENASPYN